MSPQTRVIYVGVPGPPSEGGVPDGGTTDQVLTKLSGTDGDADWRDPAAGGSDGTFVVPFTFADSAALAAGIEVCDMEEGDYAIPTIYIPVLFDGSSPTPVLGDLAEGPTMGIALTAAGNLASMTDDPPSSPAATYAQLTNTVDVWPGLPFGFRALAPFTLGFFAIQGDFSTPINSTVGSAELVVHRFRP